MFEPLEIIYASPLLMKVAFTAGLVAAVAFAATFLTMAIMDLRGGSRRIVPIGRASAYPHVLLETVALDAHQDPPSSGVGNE